MNGDHNEPEWQQVAGKKTTITRQVNVAESPITELFVGYLRFSTHAQAQKESANVQPFYTLPLEISSDEVESVYDALYVHFRKETVKGYTSGKNKTEVNSGGGGDGGEGDGMGELGRVKA